MRGPPRRELRNDSTCCKTPPRRLHPTSRLYFFVSAFSESAGDTTRFENALEAPSMLNLNGITVRLGGRAILDRASAALPPRSRVGLIGRNGAGQATLMTVMIAQLDPARPDERRVGGEGVRTSK